MGKEYTRQVSVLSLIPTLGPVVLFDDFSKGLKWTGSGDGSDYIVAESSQTFFTSGSALKLVTRYTSSAIDDEVIAELKTHCLPNLKIKCEAILRWDDNENVRAVGVKLLYNAGGTRHEAGVVYDTFDNEIQYLNSSQAFADAVGSEIHFLKDVWHRLSFEVDFNNDVYNNISLDTKSYDHSTTDIYTTTDTTGEQFRVQLLLVTETAAARTAHFDQILLQQIYNT